MLNNTKYYILCITRDNSCYILGPYPDIERRDRGAKIVVSIKKRVVKVHPFEITKGRLTLGGYSKEFLNPDHIVGE